jgi:hypothetical protein
LLVASNQRAAKEEVGARRRYGGAVEEEVRRSSRANERAKEGLRILVGVRGLNKIKTQKPAEASCKRSFVLLFLFFWAR